MSLFSKKVEYPFKQYRLC